MTRQVYTPAHHATRRAWTPHVEAGVVNCWRCHQPIQPGTRWDLGHRDDGAPSHPEHITCNRSEGATRGNRLREPRSQAWY